MKKLFTLACLVVVFFAASSSVLRAQCTPDASVTDPNGGLSGFSFSPDALPNGTVGQAITSTVVTSVLLERVDTSISTPAGNGDIKIIFLEYVFDSTSGFHSGLANPLPTMGAVPNAPVSGRVVPDTTTAANESKVCFTISGTPTVGGDSSLTVWAKVDALVNVVVGGFLPINETFLLSNPPATIGGLPFSTIIGFLPAGISTLVQQRRVPFRTNLVVADPASASAALANEIALSVAPNPGSVNSAISFNLSKSSNVTVELFDMTGRLINTVAAGNMTAGTHSFSVCADCNPAPGIYFVKVAVDGVSATSKIILN